MFNKQSMSKNSHHANTFACVALSDIGVIRKINEDACIAIIGEHNESALLVVADGMGGHTRGSIASGLAIKLFTDMWSKGRLRKDKRKNLVRAYRKIDSSIHKKLHGNKGGTTCTAAIIEGDTMTITNVGDSRAYLFRKRKLMRLTKDDSLVQALIDKGRISEADASTHPKRSVILKSLGSGEQHEPSMCEASLLESDLIMLCSDGLCGTLSDEQLESLLVAGLANMHNSTSLTAALNRLCQTLIIAAIESGSTDNITVVLCARIKQQKQMAH